MLVIIAIFRIIVVLVILSFLGSVAFALLVFFSGGQGPAFASTVSVILTIGISFVTHGLMAVFLMASAESIKVWIDIQENTQEAAFNSRYIRLS